MSGSRVKRLRKQFAPLVPGGIVFKPALRRIKKGTFITADDRQAERAVEQERERRKRAAEENESRIRRSGREYKTGKQKRAGNYLSTLHAHRSKTKKGKG